MNKEILEITKKYENAVADYETTMAEKEQLKKKLQEFAKKENRSASNFIEYLIEKWERVSKMSRVHLGMKRPIRQFNKSYKRLLELIEHFEEEPITTEVQKEVRIQMLKERFNDCLIQLNNIKNTQIDYLKESGE